MTEYCNICGTELDEDEETEGICQLCQCSILTNEDIDVA